MGPFPSPEELAGFLTDVCGLERVCQETDLVGFITENMEQIQKETQAQARAIARKRENNNKRQRDRDSVRPFEGKIIMKATKPYDRLERTVVEGVTQLMEKIGYTAYYSKPLRARHFVENQKRKESRNPNVIRGQSNSTQGQVPYTNDDNLHPCDLEKMYNQEWFNETMFQLNFDNKSNNMEDDSHSDNEPPSSSDWYL